MATTDGSHMVLFDGVDLPWKSETILVQKVGGLHLLTGIAQRIGQKRPKIRAVW